jgi:LysM repeat protein
MMLQQKIVWRLILALASCSTMLSGAPAPTYSPYLREINDHVAELRYQVANSDTELSILREKLETQERIAEALFREQTQNQKQVQDSIKAKATLLEQRLSAVENALPLLHGDITALKAHLDRQNSGIGAMQNKVNSLEELLKQQVASTQLLQQAMQTLTTAMQQESAALPKEYSDGNTSYSVREGDSLGKIARQHGIGVKALKDANSLTSDRIRVGQMLLIPKAA